MKKVLCAILTLCMLVSLFPLHSIACPLGPDMDMDDDPNSGGCGIMLWWDYSPKSKYLMIHGAGIVLDYVFGETFDIESVLLSANVTEIPQKCFYGHEELKHVSLMGIVDHISDEAFAYCGMEYMNIPSNWVCEGAFSNCMNLTTVKFGGTKYIECDAFRDCPKLDNIVLSAEKVGDYAFAGAEGARTVYVLNPNCVFGQEVFTPAVEDAPLIVYGFPGSTAEATYGDAFKPLCACETMSQDYAVTYPDCEEGGYAVYSCNVCGESLEMAYYSAGEHATSMRTLLEPTCTEYGESVKACDYCGERSDSITPISPLGHYFKEGVCNRCGIFSDNSGTCGENLKWKFRVSDGSLTISGTGEMTAMETYPWNYCKESILSVTVEEGVASIAPRAFKGSAVRTVKLPGTLTSIGEEAFCDTSLTAVRIPNRVTELGEGVFYNTAISEIVFGSGVTYIPCRTVRSQSLGDLFFPEAVAGIDQYAVRGNDNLWGFAFMNPRCLIPEDAIHNPNWGGISVRGHLGSSAQSYVREGNFWSGELLDKYLFTEFCLCSGGSKDFTVSYPDCDEGGAIVYLCNECGSTYKVDTIQAYGHEYRITEIPATCTARGVLTKECTWCGETETATFDFVDHSFTDGVCVCGLHKSETVDSLIKINHTLDLADGIALNYVVAAEQIPEHEELFMECVIPVYGDGRTHTATKVVQLAPQDRGERIFFTLSGLTAVNMGDEVQATLFLKKDGSYIASETDTYSIAQYAYKQLSSQGDKALKTLCADLLRYGAKAQDFKGYRTDTPADGNMTDEQKALLTNPDKVTFRNNNFVLEDCPDPAVTWMGKALVLDTKAAVRFVIDAADFTGNPEELSLRISYTNFKGYSKTVVLDDIEAYPSKEGAYAFTFDGLSAAELRSVLILSVFHGEEQVSDRLIYSPDTYGNGKTGELGDLCRALFAYSDSAKAWFTR